MRVLRLTTNYPAYLRQFYAKRRDLITQPYDAQLKALMDDCYGWADYWSVALKRFSYDTEEIVANAEPMQGRWAEEHGLTCDDPNWLLDVVTAQVKSFRPDVLFVCDYAFFSAPYLRRLRDECRSIKLVLGWCGAPYKDASVFREYDAVLSCVPELVLHFLADGHRCYHINHAFEPRLLARLEAEPKLCEDFIFIGSIIKQENFHHGREALLLDLVRKTDIKIWADVNRIEWQQRASTRGLQLAYESARLAQRFKVPDKLLSRVPMISKVHRWPSRPRLSQSVDRRIVKRAQPPVYALDMFNLLKRSKVVLNNHIDISTTSASNMRLFEATGVGACLLTDWKANLPEIFEPDVEVATYRSIDECVEKANYLLNNSAERKSIAAAGQRRTLRDHTFDRRSEQLDEIIRGSV